MQTLQGARDVSRQLRDAVSEQQFAFATIQSAMAKQVVRTSGCGRVRLSQYSVLTHILSHQHSQTRLPFYASIRLGVDAHERHATLVGVRDRILREGLQYVAERTRFFEPGAAFAEASRFATPRGDVCALLCDTTPLEGVTSVRAVCEALQYFLFHMEISISELLGVLMLRADNGEKHDGFFQSRLVSDVGNDVQVELNFATFSQLFGPSADFGGGREFGVVVVDAVDDDTLFPYAPATRARLDVSAAMTVTLQPRSRIVTSAGPTTAYEDDELVVVITRTCLLSLRRPDAPVAPSVMRAVRDGVERWGDAMIKKVREIVGHHHHHAYGARSSSNSSSASGALMAARQLAALDVCGSLDDVDTGSR